jgi:hypothetical protein
MRIKDFKKDVAVTVRGNDYGYFKAVELLPKTKGPQLVKVLHSSTDNFDFGLVKYFRISDLSFAIEKFVVNKIIVHIPSKILNSFTTDSDQV